MWRGSNAGGLFRALSRESQLIEVLDEFYYVSLRSETKKLKIAERLIRKWQEDEFNRTIRQQIDILKPDVVLVYKGVFVQAATLQYARSKSSKLALFYPDVSVTAHGGNIPQCIPLYDIIFTTKTFGIGDMRAKYNVKNVIFVPHGFDPDIHRPLKVTSKDRDIFGCDASFIGIWSPKKEKYLAKVKEAMPDIKMKIWGGQWEKCTTDILKSSIQGVQVIGDLYAMAIQCSSINMGILSEQVSGASSGDLITSRTFHIPGASGFMLHERNKESVLYYEEDKEAGFFETPEELATVTARYLKDEASRDKVRMAGHKRAVAEHSLDARARVIIEHLSNL
jgi:spore maturation protein CgeB